MPSKEEKMLPLETALEIATESTKHIKLTDKQEKLLEVLAVSCPIVEDGNDKYVFFNEFKGFLRNIQKAIDQKDSSFLRRQRGYKVNKVVDVIEFAESSQFYGMGGSLYPQVADALWEIFHGPRNIVEVVLTGATFIGKSFLVDCGMGYKIYLDSCLHDPQAEYDLAPGTTLLFPMQSKTEKDAKDILFYPFSDRIKESPYFKKHFFPNPKIKSRLEFPNHIVVQPFNGSDDAVIGRTVISAAITEMNRMEYVKASKRARGEEVDYDQAMQIYNTLSRRHYARTQQKGKVPGHLFLDGASEDPNDFTSVKAKEAETNDKIYMYKYKQWEVGSPQTLAKYSGEKFLVEVGDATRTSRIIQSEDEAVDASRIERIPIEYYDFFARDPEGSLKDFGGVTVTGTRPGIPYRDQITKGIEQFEHLAGGKQLFKHPEICFEDFYHKDDLDPDWSMLIDKDYIDMCLMARAVAFATHVDLSENSDACGVAVGHLSGFRKAPATNIPTRDGFKTKEDNSQPLITIDGILKVKPPRGGFIDIDWVERFLLWLPAHINLCVGTADQWQSTHMRQAFAKARWVTGVVSMDASNEPYDMLKKAYFDERIITPNHKVYRVEVTDLVFEDGKYNHPPKGSKDCADAVAGVTFMVETLLQYRKEARKMRKREERPGRQLTRRGNRARALIRAGRV